MFAWNCVWTIFWEFLKTCLALDSSFHKCTQLILGWSSMKVINHLSPESVLTLDGPQTSLWTIQNGLEGKIVKEKIHGGVFLIHTLHTETKMGFYC